MVSSILCDPEDAQWSLGGECVISPSSSSGTWSGGNETSLVGFCRCHSSIWETELAAVGCCNYNKRLAIWINVVCLLVIAGVALGLQILLTGLISYQRTGRGLKYIVKIIIARQLPGIVTLLCGVLSGILVVFRGDVHFVNLACSVLLSISGSMTVSACLVLISKHLNYLKTRLDFTKRTAIRHQRTVFIMRHLHLISFATYSLFTMIVLVEEEYMKRFLIDLFYVGDMVVCGLVSFMQYYSTIPIIKDLENMVALQSAFTTHSGDKNRIYKQTSDALRKTKSVFRTITSNTVVFCLVNMVLLLLPMRYSIIFYVVPLRQCSCHLAFYPAIILTIRRRLATTEKTSVRHRSADLSKSRTGVHKVHRGSRVQSQDGGVEQNPGSSILASSLASISQNEK